MSTHVSCEHVCPNSHEYYGRPAATVTPAVFHLSLY